MNRKKKRSQCPAEMAKSEGIQEVIESVINSSKEDKGQAWEEVMKTSLGRFSTWEEATATAHVPNDANDPAA